MRRTGWGPHSFGLDDVRWAQVQAAYPTQALGYRVWGLSPSSTADDTGGYGGFGAEGQAPSFGGPLARCTTCATENPVSPHASAIALPVLASRAVDNLAALLSGLASFGGGGRDARLTAVLARA